MGVEAFGLSIRFVEPCIGSRLMSQLSAFPAIRMLEKGTIFGYETTTGEYNDALHFIDIQISHELLSQESCASVRFSLCSYDTIDPIFLELVGQILVPLEAEVWLMTSALNQKNSYLPGDSNWLFAALPDEIVAMREHWQSLFGRKQGAVRVKESF